VANFNIQAQETSDSEIVITIERTACFGSCPVYSAQIYADGTIVYYGKDFVKITGRKQHKISEEKVEELIKAFEQVEYFSFKARYDSDGNGMSVTDQPTTTTSFSLNGEQKKVVNYYSAQKGLKTLEDKIDEIARLYEYIGPL
jgi:hypothetical protein